MAGLPMVVKYLIVFFVSMVPIVELRGAIPICRKLKFEYIFILSNSNNRKYASCSNYILVCKKSPRMGQR